jgi:uncharacterized protein YecE (DUF72 family)
MKQREMLAFYAGRFAAVELNFTWYQMPKADALDRMRGQVPPSFLFAVKLNRTLTHEVSPGEWPENARRFREGIAPLVQSGQLGAVLVQLPPFFHRTPDRRRYLANLLEALDGLPLAVEFRHASWAAEAAAEKVAASLAARRIALVAVDAPRLPGLYPPVPPAPVGRIIPPAFFYLRLHGRNAAGWRSGVMQRQFDYDYSEAELREWTEARIPAMVDRAARGFVFFNNHVRGQAPRNAEALAALLVARGLSCKPPPGRFSPCGLSEELPWTGPSST